MSSHADINIGQVVKEKRSLIPLTLLELARISGVSSSHLGRIERGERLPSARVLRKIAKPLGFSENELFMMAGFLSEGFRQDAHLAGSTLTSYRGLDPVVANALANETVEVQRSVIGILNVMKTMAKGIEPTVRS